MDADHKVETPTTDGTPPTSAPPSHKDESTVEPPQQTNSSSTHRNNKKKNKSKNKNKKQPATKPTYLEVIQQEIDDLKKKARHTYEVQARQNFEGELVDDERTISEKRMATSSLIDKLEELKTKLDTPDIRQGTPNEHPSRIPERKYENDPAKETADFQQETLTLLHFFYIVRLSQKGFFTLISQNYPKVEPNALIHLCDRLVGGSLFVVKDPKERVRSTKRKQVFDLLRKLHTGAPESIGDGFVTTFEQVRHLIYDFIGSTATHDDKTSLELPQDISISSTTSTQQPPVWIVVPFNGMMDTAQQQDRSSMSNSSSQKKSTDDTSKKDKHKPSLKSTSDEATNIVTANIPSATHEMEPTIQPNGSITPDVEKDEQLKQAETTTTAHAILENHTDQENKAPLDDTLDVTPSADTTTPITEPPSAKETPADESTLNADTTEPISTPISSTVDTDDVATDTITTDTTIITNNNSSSTTTKDSNTEQQQQQQQEEEEEASGWGTPPSSSTTASSAWTQGILPEKDQQQQGPAETEPVETMTWDDVKDGGSNDGWGSPVASNSSPPAWEGKLPDDVAAPGDETISGELTDSTWQSVSDYDQRRTMGGGGGRGRPSGHRGGAGFGQGRGGGPGGGGGYRSYGDGGRGGSSGSGMRRGPGGSANAGWSKARPLRPE